MADRYAGQDYEDRWDLPPVMDATDDAFGVQGMPPAALLGMLPSAPSLPPMPSISMPGANTFGPMLPIAGALAGYLAGVAPRGDVGTVMQGYALTQRALENQARAEQANRLYADQERLRRMQLLGNALPHMDVAGLQQVIPLAQQLNLGGLPEAFMGAAQRKQALRDAAQTYFAGGGPAPAAPTQDQTSLPSAPTADMPTGDTAGVPQSESFGDVSLAQPPKTYRPEPSMSMNIDGITMRKNGASVGDQIAADTAKDARVFNNLMTREMSRMDPSIPYEDRQRAAIQTLSSKGMMVPDSYKNFLTTPDRQRMGLALRTIEPLVQQFVMNTAMQSVKTGNPFMFSPNQIGAIVDEAAKPFGLHPQELQNIKETLAFPVAEALEYGLTGGQRPATALETQRARLMTKRALVFIPKEWNTPQDLGQTPEGKRALALSGSDPTDPMAIKRAERAGQQERLTEGALGKLPTPEGTAAGMEASGADALRAAGKADLDARVRNAEALDVAPVTLTDHAKTLDELYGDIYRAAALGERLQASVARWIPGALNTSIANLGQYLGGLSPRGVKEVSDAMKDYIQHVGTAFTAERLKNAGTALTAQEMKEISGWWPTIDTNIAVALPALNNGGGWLMHRLQRDLANLQPYGRTYATREQLLPMYYHIQRKLEAESKKTPASQGE